MKTLSAILFSLVMATSLVACDSDDGAAENVGEKIDQGMDNVKDSLDDAGDKIEDACEEATDKDC